MIDLGVAFAWIAISVASTKGLSAFARSAAANDTDEELASPAVNGAFAHTGLLAIAVNGAFTHTGLRSFEATSHLTGDC